jgi:hypothetical protein
MLISFNMLFFHGENFFGEPGVPFLSCNFVPLAL